MKPITKARYGSENQRAQPLPGRLLPRRFYAAPPDEVAPRLLGKLLVRRMRRDGTKYLAGRIVEVEAYLGPHSTIPDPAAHSHRGLTPRNAVMFGPAGHAYVYFIYGMHFCMNVTCEREGRAGAILMRALEPVAGLAAMARLRKLSAGVQPALLTSGPGRLAQAFGITRARHNGLDLADQESELQIRDDGWVCAAPMISTRIGIRHAAGLPLRFSVPGHACVSGPARNR